MHLAYVDESHSKNHYYLAALLVDESACMEIQNGLDELGEWIRENHGIGRFEELHAHPLFHGIGVWKSLYPRERINIYSKVFDVMASTDAALIIRGVDIKRQKERYELADPAHEVVLPQLMERINGYACRKDDIALVICDEIHTHARHREAFRDFKRFGTPGYKSSMLRHIVDTIHFAPSDHSRLLQAVDMVAFLYHRIQHVPESHPKAEAANRRLWNRVLPNVEYAGEWRP